jgi:hypothetical protein
VAERTLSWLNRLRRLTIRYERRADIHEAFLEIGCILICWNFSNGRFVRWSNGIRIRKDQIFRADFLLRMPLIVSALNNMRQLVAKLSGRQKARKRAGFLTFCYETRASKYTKPDRYLTFVG